MFNENEFINYPTFLPILSRFNKFKAKGKIRKLEKIIDDLEHNLKERENLSIITYIFSIIAENMFDLLKTRENFFKEVSSLLNSKKEDVRINSVIIIGFYLKNVENPTDSIVQDLTQSLIDDSEDVRDNIHIFLQDFKIPLINQISSHRDLLIQALSLEVNKLENAINLLKIINSISFFTFSQYYRLRDILIIILHNTSENEFVQIKKETVHLITKMYNLKDSDEVYKMGTKGLLDFLDKNSLFIKHDLNKIKKHEDKNLNQYLDYIRNSSYHENEIYFYIKVDNNIAFYEFEKEKLTDFFKTENKISSKTLLNLFSAVCDQIEDVTAVIKMLIKFNHISGYVSELGNFYSNEFLIKEFHDRLNEKGIISLDKYDYLPDKFISRILRKFIELNNNKLLFGRNKRKIYSLEKIKNQITSKASILSTINLKNYRDRLQKQDFISLIKNLPKEYLTKFRKGTVWLTTIGEQKVLKEIENSKIIGFFDLDKVSNNLNINSLLLMDILDVSIDQRSGIWNNEKKIFYYSKFIKNEISKIQKVRHPEERHKLVIELSRHLNIDKNHILTKIDENLKLIGQEILKKEQIEIDVYLEKTGMKYNNFINYLNNDLEIEYIKRGNTLLFNERKIHDARNDIKKKVLKDIRNKEYIDLNSYDLQADIIKQIIEELQEEKNILGIMKIQDKTFYFYTEIGLKQIMLQKRYSFSLSELFYGKELSESELQILKKIFISLKDSKKLKGKFDEGTLTFTSAELLFDLNYENLIKEFENLIGSYLEIFKQEFNVIKEILNKTKEIIFPQEIRNIQNKIDKINDNSIVWESKIEAFMTKASVNLLSKQGFTLKQYRALSNSLIKEKEVIFFKEEAEVLDLRDQFRIWMSRFHELEQKYPVIIFHQKSLQRDPNNKESNTQIKQLKTKLGL